MHRDVRWVAVRAAGRSRDAAAAAIVGPTDQRVRT
jgi:hypothetical protein